MTILRPVRSVLVSRPVRPVASHDVVINITQEGPHLRVHGRRGHIDVPAPDVFWLTERDAGRVPASWRKFIEPDGALHRCRWPEPIGRGGSRRGRLDYFWENVFAPAGVSPLEADVGPADRFLADSNVVLETKWRLLFFDLETEKVADWSKPWRSRILSFSWRNDKGERGHVRTAALTDEAERATVAEFARLADRHDILLAWNGARFDNQVVASRATILGVPFDPSVYHWLDHLWLFKRYYLRTEDGGVTSSFALDHVGGALVGDRKVPIEERCKALGWTGSPFYIEWAWAHAPALLEEYNDQDVELMAKIEERTGFVALHLALCNLCRVLPAERSLYSLTQVDGRMFQVGRESGYHFPTKREPEKGSLHHTARGAFVPEATIGLHRSVAVVDYARMYPSIILTFNMSIETVDPSGELAVPDTSERGAPTGKTVARFKREPEGLFPRALRTVLLKRKEYDAERKNAEVGSPHWQDLGRLSAACKAFANSFYGAILSIYGRYYRPEIGESVTSFGRHLLSNTIQAVKDAGHPFIFGDTDSVAFVATDDQAAAVRDRMNLEIIPSLVRAAGAEPGHVALEYEKRFASVIVTASKRYAGRFAIYKGRPADESTPIDVRGLEIVRSDVCTEARDLQRTVVEWILHGVEGVEIRERLEDVREKFLLGEIDLTRIVLAKRITKHPDEYVSKPPQVRVAEWLSETGEEVSVGDKVPFLILRGGPRHPRSVEKGAEVDRVLYWNKHVFAATERVLSSAFPALMWAGLRVAKGVAAEQLPLLPRRVSSVPPPRDRTTETQAGNRPVRPVATPPIVLEVPEGIDPARLGGILRAFPGSRRVRVDVRTTAGVAELACPFQIADPSTVPAFASALRAIGARGKI